MNITENIQKLITLAADHPELPIIAMVDGEVVGDDSYSRWVGYFGSVELGEFVLYNDRFIDDREEFKEQFYDYNDDELCKKFGYEPCINEYSFKTGHYTQEQYNENEENGKKLEKYLDEVAEKAFEKVIIVNIDTPNDIERFEEAKTNESDSNGNLPFLWAVNTR